MNSRLPRPTVDKLRDCYRRGWVVLGFSKHWVSIVSRWGNEWWGFVRGQDEVHQFHLENFSINRKELPFCPSFFHVTTLSFFMLYLAFLFSALSLLTLHSRILNFLISLFCQIFILAFTLIFTFPFRIFSYFIFIHSFYLINTSLLSFFSV